MLDQTAIRNVAEEYCRSRNDQFPQYSLRVVRGIDCARPPGTYFSLRHSEPVVGGPVGLFVWKESGRSLEFGSGWHYDTVEFFYRRVLDVADPKPEEVIEALLHPSQLEYLVGLASERGIDWEQKM